jgi:hypothetical protein
MRAPAETLVSRKAAVAWIGSWDAQQREFGDNRLLCGVLGAAAPGSAG